MNSTSKISPTPIAPLTAKEKAVLEFIESCLQKQGISPSYQEMKDHFGFASLNSIQRYLKQLQRKGYIHIPGGNQKRAITLLQPSTAVQSSLNQIQSPTSHVGLNPFVHPRSQREAPPQEPLSIPLLGRVAAGRPIEAMEDNEFVDAPPSLLRNPHKTFALHVEGQSMIEDGIFDGDLIYVQKQSYANNGDIVVASVENEATVKRFYLHSDNTKVINKNPQTYSQTQHTPLIELRPANSQMNSLWFEPKQVEIKGVVVGLVRRF